MKDRTSISSAAYRSYIDIDEDTTFVVTPDVFWVDDVDSDEALIISELSKGTGRYA